MLSVGGEFKTERSAKSEIPVDVPVISCDGWRLGANCGASSYDLLLLACIVKGTAQTGSKRIFAMTLMKSVARIAAGV
jgi:hypothetical protein